MDCLLFVEEKLCLFLISNFSLNTIFIYYQPSKHISAVSAHMFTLFMEQNSLFLASQKFRIPKGGLSGRNERNECPDSILLLSPLGHVALKSPLCNFRWQYITPGDVTMTFHLSDSATIPIMDRSHFSQVYIA